MAGKNTYDYILKIGMELSSNKQKVNNEICFSNVIYQSGPIVDKKNCIKYEYFPMLLEKKGDFDIKEHLFRLKNFNINKLPLIEVAKRLKIKIEKSKILPNGVFGKYSREYRKIIMGTDSEQTFIHELAHAIDHILPNQVVEPSYMEVVAEYSTIVLSKKYNIAIDTSASSNYLNYYSEKYSKHCSETNTKMDIKNLVRRVALIYEFVRNSHKSKTSLPIS